MNPAFPPYGYNPLKKYARFKRVVIFGINGYECRHQVDCPRCGRYKQGTKYENPVKSLPKRVICGVCGCFIRNHGDLLR